MNPDISYFGRTNGRPPQRSFGIKQADRLSHVYVIGRTGTGKTNLLEILALQDIWSGRGVCVVDPHGDLVKRLAERTPEHRRRGAPFLDPAAPAHRSSYNPLPHASRARISLSAPRLLLAVKKLLTPWWGVGMGRCFYNARL